MHNNKYTDHPLHNPKYQTDHFKFQVCHMKYQIYHPKYKRHNLKYQIYHPKFKIHHSKFQINHLKYQINYPKYHSHAPKKRNTKNCIGQVHSDRRQSRVIDLINLATYLSCHTAAATISNISNIFCNNSKSLRCKYLSFICRSIFSLTRWILIWSFKYQHSKDIPNLDIPSDCSKSKNLKWAMPCQFCTFELFSVAWHAEND